MTGRARSSSHSKDALSESLRFRVVRVAKRALQTEALCTHITLVWLVGYRAKRYTESPSSTRSKKRASQKEEEEEEEEAAAEDEEEEAITRLATGLKRSDLKRTISPLHTHTHTHFGSRTIAIYSALRTRFGAFPLSIRCRMIIILSDPSSDHHHTQG